MRDRYYFYNDRTLCDVLEEMRSCHKTLNFAPMLSLIEEAQIMGDRRESGLGQKREIRKRERHLAELKKKIKKHEDDSA